MPLHPAWLSAGGAQFGLGPFGQCNGSKIVGRVEQLPITLEKESAALGVRSQRTLRRSDQGRPAWPSLAGVRDPPLASPGRKVKGGTMGVPRCDYRARGSTML
jgi:hypothetical protein